jgi:hypothetical protein
MSFHRELRPAKNYFSILLNDINDGLFNWNLVDGTMSHAAALQNHLGARK